MTTNPVVQACALHPEASRSDAAAAAGGRVGSSLICDDISIDKTRGRPKHKLTVGAAGSGWSNVKSGPGLPMEVRDRGSAPTNRPRGERLNRRS